MLASMPRRLWLRVMLGASVTFAALVGPFLSAGQQLVSSLVLMARTWDFNGSLFYLASALLPDAAVRPALVVVMAAAIAAGTIAGRCFVSRSLFAVGAFYACSTTVYPWYVVWMLPLLALRPQVAFFVFAALIPFADLVMIDFVTQGRWHPEAWTRWIIYGPPMGLALWEITRATKLPEPARERRGS
jgi:hypothetical protein